MNTIIKSSALSLFAYVLLSTTISAAPLLGGGLGGVVTQNSNGSLGVFNNTVTVGGNGTATIPVTTGGNSSSGGLDNLVSVTGTPQTGTTVDVLDGASGNGNPAASVNLNLGNSHGPDASVDLLPGATGSNGVDVTADLGNVAGADSDVLVSLFGGSGGSDGGSNVSLDLFGNGGNGDGSGTGGGDDTSDRGIAGGGRDFTMIPISGLGGSGGLRTASIDPAGSACFTPNADQIAKLSGRHAYTAATFSSWANVKALKIVRIDLCISALKHIAGQGNIARLQQFVGGNAVLKASLHQQGLSASSVIGADRQGNALVLYVS